MKNLLKIALLTSGLIMATASFAGADSFENKKTTCYLFKNNKLAKKAQCSYEGSSGGSAAGYAFFNVDFHVKGYGKISINDSWTGKDDGSGYFVDDKVIQTIDEKKAIRKERDAKTYKILPENNKANNKLTCYATKNATHELCYVDNTPR